MSRRVRSDRLTPFDLGEFVETIHNCYCLILCMGTGISWGGGGLVIYEVVIVLLGCDTS